MTAAGSLKKKGDGLKPGTLLTHILFIGIAVLWVYPFVWMVSASFKSSGEFFGNRLRLLPQEFTWENIIRVWTAERFSTYFLNSVVITVFTVLLVLAMTALTGYVLGRYEFFGKKLMLGLFVASITIPLASTIIPIYQIIRQMGLVGTRTGVVLASAGGGHVIFLLLFLSAFKALPKELEEAAILDGCGFFGTFWHVMLHLVRPVCVTVVIMETIWSWNSFLLPLVLTLSNPASRTLAVGLYSFQGENTVDWTGIAAGGTIAVVPIIVLFIAMQKYFVDGVAGAVKS